MCSCIERLIFTVGGMKVDSYWVEDYEAINFHKLFMMVSFILYVWMYVYGWRHGSKAAEAGREEKIEWKGGGER